MPCKNHPQVINDLKSCSRCRQTFCPDCVVELKGQFYCVDCKNEQVKDIQSGADTTELEMATVGKRFAALFIDGLVSLIPVMGVAFVMGFFLAGMAANPASLIVFELIIGVVASIPVILYEGLMLAARGQTLGKMAMKIKVVTAEGDDISAGQAWGRSLCRAVFNQLRIFGIINYLFAFGKERTCLHDRIAKTRVINWK